MYVVTGDTPQFAIRYWGNVRYIKLQMWYARENYVVIAYVKFPPININWGWRVTCFRYVRKQEELGLGLN